MTTRPAPKGYVLDDKGQLWHHAKAPRRPSPAPQRFDQAEFVRALQSQLRDLESRRPSSPPCQCENSPSATEYRRRVLAEAVREDKDERALRKRGAA